MDEAIAIERNKGRAGVLATVPGLCKEYAITMREVKACVLECKPGAAKDGVAAAKKPVVYKTAVYRARSTKK